MLSTVAQVLVIWFLVATVAALGLGAILGAILPPTPLPVPKRVNRSGAAPRGRTMAACGSRR